MGTVRNIVVLYRLPLKAQADDFAGRFREIVSDPLNLLIERVPMAGVVENGEVWPHNGNRVPLAGSGAYFGEFSQILVINRGVHEPLEEFIFQALLRTLSEAFHLDPLAAAACRDGRHRQGGRLQNRGVERLRL